MPSLYEAESKLKQAQDALDDYARLGVTDYDRLTQLHLDLARAGLGVQEAGGMTSRGPWTPEQIQDTRDLIKSMEKEYGKDLSRRELQEAIDKRISVEGLRASKMPEPSPGTLTPQDFANMGKKGVVVRPGAIQYGGIVDVYGTQMSVSDFGSMNEGEKDAVTLAAAKEQGDVIQGINKQREQAVIEAKARTKKAQIEEIQGILESLKDDPEGLKVFIDAAKNGTDLAAGYAAYDAYAKKSYIDFIENLRKTDPEGLKVFADAAKNGTDIEAGNKAYQEFIAKRTPEDDFKRMVATGEIKEKDAVFTGVDEKGYITYTVPGAATWKVTFSDGSKKTYDTKEAANKAIAEAGKTEEKIAIAISSKLEPYAIYPEGDDATIAMEKGKNKPIGYDLNKAVTEVDRATLVSSFGEKEVAAAEQYNSDVKLLSKYPSIESAIYIGDKDTREAAVRLFGKTAVDQAEAKLHPVGETTVGGLKLANPIGDLTGFLTRSGLFLEQKTTDNYNKPSLETLSSVATEKRQKADALGIESNKNPVLAAVLAVNQLAAKEFGKAPSAELIAAQKNLDIAKDLQQKAIEAGLEATQAEGRYYSAKGIEVSQKGLTTATQYVDKWVELATKKAGTGGKIVGNITAGAADAAIGIASMGTVIANAVTAQSPVASMAHLAGIPLGMATWLSIQTPLAIATDPIAGVSRLSGQVLAPIVIPKALGAIKGKVEGGIAVTRTMVEGGVLPRGLKTGGADVFAVKLPPEYFKEFTTEQLKQVFESGLSPEQQIAKAAEFMAPDARSAFLSTVKLTGELSQFKVPESMHRSAAEAFQQVDGISPATAQALADWAAKNNKSVVMKGSTADYAQGMNLKPGDFDVVINEGSKLTPELAKQQIKELFEKTGTKWNDKLFDIKNAGDYTETLPYGWKALDPVLIDKVRFQSLGSQFINRGANIVTPGIGEAKGLLPLVKKGVKSEEILPQKAIPQIKIGAYAKRYKDVARFELEAEAVIQLIRESGDTAKSARLQGLLDNLYEYEGKANKGRVKALPKDAEAEYRQAFIDMVGEVQVRSLKTTAAKVSGVEPLTGGTLTRFSSPSTQLIQGTVYTAVRDIGPYKRAAAKGYLQAGYLIDETGKVVKAPRPEIFTSPDAAFMRLRDIEGGGGLPETAGIVAIRTTATDVGKGRMISPAFRTEFITDSKGKSHSIVYDELTINEGSNIYATAANERGLSPKSVTGGKTGESVTYDPLSHKQVPVLWFATDAAKTAGMGAPSAAVLKAVNIMALKGMIADLLHPHISRIEIGTETPKVPQSLLQFYKDTYTWKNSKEKLAIKVNAEAESISNEAVATVKRTKPEVYKQGGKEYIEAVERAESEIANKRMADLVSKDKDIRELVKESNSSELGKSYVVNLSRALDSVALAGLSTKRTDVVSTKAKVSSVKQTTSSKTGTVQMGVTSQLTSVPVSLKATSATLTSPKLTETVTSNVVTKSVKTGKVTSKPITEVKTIPTKMTKTPVTLRVDRVSTKIKTGTVTVEITPPTKTPPPPTDKPPAKNPVILKGQGSQESKRELFRGAISWKQGFGYYSVKAPYKSRADVAFFYKTPPEGARVVEGGAQSAYKSIQLIAGKAPVRLLIDMGFMDVNITKPTAKPGASGAITFRRDVGNQTSGIRIASKPGNRVYRPARAIQSRLATIK